MTNNLDDFMCSHIDKDWDEITDKILNLCKNRSHVLKVAFDLHKQGNYIASIPLLLNQSDGICGEEFANFFTKDSETGLNASSTIIKQAECGEIHINFLSKLLLEPFKIKTQISQSSSKNSKAAKSKGPNRHGIIHGSRSHLDYGNKLNGYKAFSFLAFIVFSTKDAFKKK